MPDIGRRDPNAFDLRRAQLGPPARSGRAARRSTCRRRRWWRLFNTIAGALERAQLVEAVADFIRYQIIAMGQGRSRRSRCIASRRSEVTAVSASKALSQRLEGAASMSEFDGGEDGRGASASCNHRAAWSRQPSDKLRGRTLEALAHASAPR